MDANQSVRSNPYGMDETCRNCPALCETRERIVHGYGDVGADFLFVGERPTRGAEANGVPFVTADGSDDPGANADVDPDPDGGGKRGADAEPGPDADDAPASGTTLRRILERLGLCGATSPPDRPVLENAYLTLLTRCRHPERPPTDEEVANCEPFLNADIRSINPEILVPVGERALAELGVEYTTTPVDDLSLPDVHGERVRGRGFELVPMIDPREQTADQTQAWVEAFAQLLASDYRQTKGRRGR